MAKQKQTKTHHEAKFNPVAKQTTTRTSGTRPDAVVSKIITEFKDRQRAEIRRWRDALTAATDPGNQRTYPLQDMYDNLRADGHYISQVELRKSATLCNTFSIIDRATGKEQPEKCDFFNKQWFYDLIDNALDAVTRGYTLIELVDPYAPHFTLIPRRNIAPLRSQILLSVNDDRGIDYRPMLSDTLIQVANPDNLGLMADLCGQLIWKRNAQQAWAEFSERFGQPLITATTNQSSDTEIARIRAMLSTLGEAAQAVLPLGTTIDIKQAAMGDAYQVFDRQIDRINSEMSKPLTGGTMISDNGSSRSQSEVHERNLDDKIAARDRRIITFIVNDQLIPMLARFGHPLNPDQDRFQFDESYNLTLTDHWNIVRSGYDLFHIPHEWISRKFGFPIDALRQPDTPTPPDTLTAAVQKGGFTANFQ